MCESDSLCALKFIKNGVEVTHLFIQLFQRLFLCGNMTGLYIEFKHTLQEGNQVADYLAKDGGAQGDDPLVILDICPLSLKPKLLADALGV